MAKDLKEQIEIMTHYLNGGVVECTESGSDEWVVANTPCWDWFEYDYRIKEQKPKVVISKWLIQDVSSGEYFIIESSDVDLTVIKFTKWKKIKLIETYEVEI